MQLPAGFELSIPSLLMVCKQANLKEGPNFPFIFLFWFHMPQQRAFGGGWRGEKRIHRVQICTAAQQGCQ